MESANSRLAAQSGQTSWTSGQQAKIAASPQMVAQYTHPALWYPLVNKRTRQNNAADQRQGEGVSAEAPYSSEEQDHTQNAFAQQTAENHNPTLPGPTSRGKLPFQNPMVAQGILNSLPGFKRITSPNTAQTSPSYSGAGKNLLDAEAPNQSAHL